MTDPSDVISNPALERLYTLEEVADHLRLTVRTVNKFVASGRLTVRRFGRSPRVGETELKRFLLEGTAPKKTVEAEQGVPNSRGYVALDRKAVFELALNTARGGSRKQSKRGRGSGV